MIREGEDKVTRAKTQLILKIRRRRRRQLSGQCREDMSCVTTT
jgi:hypothetical protein